MAKGSKKKKRTQQGTQVKDTEMKEIDAPQPQPETALPEQVSLDDLIVQQEKMRQKATSGGVKKKQLARGQRNKAQQQRKVDRLEKAMAARDKYAGKCSKKQAAKQAKSQLTSMY